MELLKLNTSMFEWAKVWFRLNQLYPTDSFIEYVIADLKATIKDGRHPLRVLDQHTADFINKPPSQRNLNAEYIARVSREKGVSNEEAAAIIEARNLARKKKSEKLSQKNSFWSLKLPEVFELEPDVTIGIVTIEGLFQFPSQKLAAQWLQDKFNYNDVITALVTINRHKNNGKPNKKGFRIFKLNQ